ncbi:hypothetical protein OIU85_010490 [Salix viminalis]|uniref:Uncharacterized protein n=1 Tax=Salix viminalis TaxID=40686 RepID=A0A9Q0SGW1_SALVM|nr:hypothetical protein OIU85_010490 [Salix viminalis]
MIRRRFLGGGVTILIGVLDGVTENMGNSRGVKREVRQGIVILVISVGTVFASLGRLGVGINNTATGS